MRLPKKEEFENELLEIEQNKEGTENIIENYSDIPPPPPEIPYKQRRGQDGQNKHRALDQTNTSDSVRHFLK